MDHSQAEKLPTFDIQFALAQTLVWSRYRERINRNLQEGAGSSYVGVVIEHSTRLQRLAEGLTAFSTTGAQEEVQGLMRPCYEIFASQCLVQCGHVNHPAKRPMTPDERAEAYLLHAEFVRLQLLRRHPNWSGHQHPPEERNKVAAEIETRIASSGHQFVEGRPWHNMDFGAALRAGLKGASRRFGKQAILNWGDIMPLMQDYMNSGIHGNSFSSRFLRTRQTDGKVMLIDDRTPRQPENWSWAFVIANISLEFLADEFGERCLIQPMLNSTKDEIKHHPDRFVTHFPTARIHLST